MNPKSILGQNIAAIAVSVLKYAAWCKWTVSLLFQSYNEYHIDLANEKKSEWNSNLFMFCAFWHFGYYFS